MKVDPTRTARTDALRRSDKAKGGGSGFAKALDGLLGGGEAPRGVSGAVPVDSLLAVQGVEERGGGRARRRGEELLDRLEELRDGLLAGAIPVDRLRDLKRMVDARREAVADPRLDEILGEIELRVRVELAKLGLEG
ncbi:MAG: hypothetical protein OHK0024_15040 [Thalassobaculales bacterium]